MKRTSLIRTVAVVAAVFAGGAQAAEMTIFQGRDFRGPSYTLKGNANLADIDFQNKVSSIVVRSGTWDVCTEPDLAGQCATLYPGEYPVLNSRLNDRIESGYLSGASRLGGLPGIRKVVWPDEGTPAPRLLTMSLEAFAADREAAGEECFGPLGLVVTYERLEDVAGVLAGLPGQLTTSLHAEQDEAAGLADLAEALADRSGRVLWNQWPTGVSVTHAMQHGGPFPATTTPATTSVGTAAIERFLRPVAYQNWPQELLPPPLRDDNPWGVPQRR